MTRVRVSGGVFVVAFVGAFVLFGEMLGSFADSDQVFIDRYDDAALRIRDIVAAYLLAVGALAFASLTHTLASRSSGETVLLRISGTSRPGDFSSPPLPPLRLP
jgi:hypothetical protein